VLSLFIIMPHSWRILAFIPKTMPMARPSDCSIVRLSLFILCLNYALLYCCIVLAQLCSVLRFDKAVESGDVRFRESNYFLFNSLCKSIFYLTEYCMS